MIGPALKTIETMVLEEADHEPRFDIGVRKYGVTKGNKFQVAIYGNGFEATRNCNRDELIAMRDWIGRALESDQ